MLGTETMEKQTALTGDIQAEVDQYLQLHEEMSQLKKHMDVLKKSIRGYMETEGLTSIPGNNGKQVYLQPAKASNSTSRYTDYELRDIMTILEGKDLKKVTEIRVNADKLKGVMTTLPEHITEQIKQTKQVKEGTPRFSVKKIK